MKVLIYSLFVFISFSNQSFSQEAVEKKSPPLGNAIVGDYYGANVSNVSIDKAISVNEIEEVLRKDKKIADVAVKGKVIDVCEKRGCWLTLKTDDGSSFFVKMKDYAFFVPTTLKGKNIVLEGNARREVTSVDELKHYAKDAKKTKSEINAITSPKEEIRFLASGIRVVE